MDDTIYRQEAIDVAIEAAYKWDGCYSVERARIIADDLKALPSAQPEISRIEKELHGKTPEEQYEFLYWLLLKFGLSYTDSRLAVIAWLRGEKEDE